MEHQSITLRNATPTLEDGSAFAQYLDEAAEGFFLFMLGRHYIDIIARAFIRPNHDLSYQTTTFAEHNGDIAGMISGYSAEQHRTSTLHPLQQAAGKWHLRMRMRIVNLLSAPLLSFLNSIEDDEYYIQAIAVNKELRGKGLGSILMDSIEKQAYSSGASRLSLDVSANNCSARELYEHRGFNIEARWPKRLPISSMKLYRMTKMLI
jgi:ribosomal protein S18 acetylase RimI-like enzyme